MGNGSFIRKVNRMNILELIRVCHPVSRAVISRELGLSRSTVTEIVEELLSEGLVKEGSSGQSTPRGGRRSVQLEFVPTAKYTLGIDIGGTKTIFLLTDLCGHVVAQKKILSHKEGMDPLTHIQREVDTFLSCSGVDRDRIVGTGIGAPGITNYKTGTVVASPGLNWFDVNLREHFKHTLPNPILVDNDVNMAVIGEKWIGNGVPHTSVVQVSIGTGIGAGLIIDGTVYRGVHSYAGEIGYFQVDPFTNDKSGAGEFGAFEQLASGRGIANLANSLLGSYPDSDLHGQDITSERVFEAALNKDTLAVLVIESLVHYIAFALTNIISLLDPGVVILGGGVSQSLSGFFESIASRVQDLVPIPVTILPASLGEEAGAFGAAATALIATGNLNLNASKDDYQIVTTHAES